MCVSDVNSDEQVPGIKNNGHNENLHSTRSHGGGPKTWTQEDMDMALDALRNHNMSLTKVTKYFFWYFYDITKYYFRLRRLTVFPPLLYGKEPID